MRSWVILAVFGSLCACVQAQCDVKDGKHSVPFPKIEDKAFESFQMSVKYTVPGANHTDYYVEYYDILNRRGSVVAHQGGKPLTYIYNPPTFEAWDIAGLDCTFKFLNETPEMFRDAQEDWFYLPYEEKKQHLLTVGPSAMLKIAYEEWYKTVNTSNPKVFYMGEYESTVNGMKGVYWRRCDGELSYVDYVFTGENYENPFGLKDFKTIPLRIFFGGRRMYRAPELSTQIYDITLFQPFISLGLRPFDLPKGRGCRRRDFGEDDDDIPQPPDFAGSNLQFSAEVIYQTVDSKGEPNEFSSYYNTVNMALDVRSQLLSYQYAPWNETAPKNKPDELDLEYTMFDMMHGHLYQYNLADDQCQIARQRSFVPVFELPRGRGGISLPEVLFPSSKSIFLSEGVNRGLNVNVFEEVIDNYLLFDGDYGFIQIPKAIITRTYLQYDEEERNANSAEYALTEVQMRFIGRLKDKVTEIVTMNFNGFSTEIRNKQKTFNIESCFKYDHDSVWITLTFNADESVLNKIKQDVPSIQANVLNAITIGSELNIARIPIVEVDFKNALHVTMQILRGPPALLDFELAQNGKKVTDTKEQEALIDGDTCATKCLESGDCWGFSMCGAVCTFGVDSSKKVEDTKDDCQLYMRDSNGFQPSTDLIVQNLRQQVHDGMLQLVLVDEDNNIIQLAASSIDITDPRK